MEFGQVTKTTLINILNNTPRTTENQGIVNTLLGYINSNTIQAVPYTYSAVYYTAGANNTLAAGVANVPSNVNIQADADFLILNQTFRADSLNASYNSGAVPQPGVIVTVSDTGSGMSWMDQAVPVPALFGTGQFPYVLPEPKLVLAKATLQVLASNTDQTTGYNLRLMFNGVKLFKYPGS